MNRRAQQVLGQLGAKPSVSIPAACGGWDETNTCLTYIADREGDLYDLFVEAPCPDSGADWLIRGQYHDRRLVSLLVASRDIFQDPEQRMQL